MQVKVLFVNYMHEDVHTVLKR